MVPFYELFRYNKSHPVYFFFLENIQLCLLIARQTVLGKGK
jgi:hypothetical protein